MHKTVKIASLMGAFLLFGCTSQIKTNTTYDDTADFASYKTFAQAPAPTHAQSMPGYSEITGRKIQQRIAYNLEQKGLELASADEADLVVSFTLGGQPRQEVEYYGGWGWYGPGMVDTENYVEGSLVIDMGDRVKKRLVWHGYGTEDIFTQSGADEILFRAVDAVLEKYPPGAEAAGK